MPASPSPTKNASEPPHAPLRAAVHRTAIAVFVVVYMQLGYHLAAATALPGRAHTLRTRLDDAVPFWAWTVWFYSWVYTSMLYPAFVVRSRALFRRTVVAYLAVLTLSFAVFAAYPVSAEHFRPGVDSLDTTKFAEWAVRLTYFVDPPVNLFPSLHLSIATLAALVAMSARPLYGLLAAPVVIAIGISILTMKQHYVADGVAGLVFAFIAWCFIIRPHRAKNEPEPLAYGWRAALAYLIFHAAAYASVYAAFCAGYAPWHQ